MTTLQCFASTELSLRPYTSAGSPILWPRLYVQSRWAPPRPGLPFPYADPVSRVAAVDGCSLAVVLYVGHSDSESRQELVGTV